MGLNPPGETAGSACASRLSVLSVAHTSNKRVFERTLDNVGPWPLHNSTSLSRARTRRFRRRPRKADIALKRGEYPNELMGQEAEVLSGEVEADETYYGAKRKRGTPRGRPGPDSHKTPVMGIVERKGRIVASVIPDVSATTLRGTIKRFVLPGTMIYTDEFIQYRKLDQEGFFHRRVYHRQGVYVSGAVHTNTIEGFFGHFKTDVRGTHLSISRRWLDSYLNEWVWKWNHRDDDEAMFRQLLHVATSSTH
jgi:transposase-like protein